MTDKEKQELKENKKHLYSISYLGCIDIVAKDDDEAFEIAEKELKDGNIELEYRVESIDDETL